MNCVGPMWWYAYGKVGPDGQTIGAPAERVLKLMWLAGIGICVAAPFFSKGSFVRRLSFAAISGLLAVGVYYLVGVIVMFVILGY